MMRKKVVTMTIRGHMLDLALAVLAGLGLAVTLSVSQAEALDTSPQPAQVQPLAP
jgi:hypothetical protein